MMALAIVVAGCCSKDQYIKNIYTYGLAFSNFGFMGNAVVSVVFPDMFVALIVGIIIGLAGFALPTPIMTVITTAGNCMSPIAMLLTGITVANMDVKKVLSLKSIYAVSFVRLIVFPLLFIGVFKLIPMSQTIMVCTICSLAMPLGLSTIVVPGGYGRDTSVAAGMTIVSHLLSAITIPTVFYIMMNIL